MKSFLFCIATMALPVLLVPSAVGAGQPKSNSVGLFQHKEGDEHKGERKDLGEKKVGGYTARVTQFGEIKAGEEAVFVIVLSGGSGKPKAVRGWVGVESGERSIKTKAEEEGAEYHLHHQVSKPMPKDSKLWIEVETSSGRQKVSFEPKP
jgi:hypothetical protein